MRFIEMRIGVIDQHTGVAVLAQNQIPGWMVGMAGDRRGRINKGPRKVQTVRFPVDQYAHYAARAEALQIPVGDYVAYRIAVTDGFKIPDQVLLAHPGLVQLLPEHDRAEALRTIPKLAERFATLIGPEPLPLNELIDNTPKGDKKAA